MPAHKSQNTIVLKRNMKWHVNANNHVCFLHLVSCYGDVIWTCIVQRPCSPFGTCVGWSDGLCLVSVWVRSDFQYDGFLNITTIAKPVAITLFWDTHTNTHQHTHMHTLAYTKRTAAADLNPSQCLNGMNNQAWYVFYTHTLCFCFVPDWYSCHRGAFSFTFVKFSHKQITKKIIESDNVIFWKIVCLIFNHLFLSHCSKCDESV